MMKMNWEEIKNRLRVFKKRGPALLFAFLFIFMYNLFLKKAFVHPNLEEDVVTTNLKYFGRNFEIYSEKNIERAGKRFFHNFKATNEDGEISAGYAEAKSEKDISFSNGLEGESSDWHFKALEGRYFKDSKGEIVFTLVKDVYANNHSKGISIKSDQFRISDNFKRVKLSGNISIYSNETKIDGQKAEYDQNNNHLEVADSVVVELERVINGKLSKVVLETTALEYNTSNKEMISRKSFTIKFKEYTIHGKEIEVRGDNFYTPHGLKVINKGDDTEIYLDGVSYEDKIFVAKNLRGKYEGASVKADHISNSDEITELLGNVVFNRRDRRVICDKLSITSKEIVASSNVELKLSDSEITSEQMIYDRGKKIFKFDSANIKSRDRDIKAVDLEYHEESESGSMRDVVIEGESESVHANYALFDIKNEEYTLSGDVKIERDSVDISTDSVNIKRDTISMDRVKAVEEGVVVNLTNCFIDRESSDLYTKDTITGEKDGYIFSSRGLKYNLDSQNGYLEDSIKIENREEQFSLYSPKVSIVSNDLVFGKIEGSKEGALFQSLKGRYLRREKILQLSEEVEFKREDLEVYSDQINIESDSISFDSESNIIKRDILIIAQKGEVYFEGRRVVGEKIAIFRENGDILRANYMEADDQLESSLIRGDVVGEFGGKANFTADRGRIFFSTKSDSEDDRSVTRAELLSNIKFYFKDISIYSDYLEYDNSLGADNRELVFAKDNLKLSFTSPYGDVDAKAKYAFYDINREVGRMKNSVVVTYKHRVQGIINIKSNDAYHNNELNRIAFLGNASAIGTKGNLKITGDDVELDMNTGIIRGRGQSGFVYDLKKKGSKSDLSDSIISEFEEDIKSADKILQEFSN